MPHIPARGYTVRLHVFATGIFQYIPPTAPQLIDFFFLLEKGAADNSDMSGHPKRMSSTFASSKKIPLDRSTCAPPCLLSALLFKSLCISPPCNLIIFSKFAWRHTCMSAAKGPTRWMNCYAFTVYMIIMLERKKAYLTGVSSVLWRTGTLLNGVPRASCPSVSGLLQAYVS